MYTQEFQIALIGILAGAIGYLIVTFWFQPILRYREIKFRIAADLVFFANALTLQATNGTLREDSLKRKDSNRLCASELQAIYRYLPWLYLLFLKSLGEKPLEAASDLIGLSNSSERREAVEFEKNVRKNLRIPEKRKT